MFTIVSPVNRGHSLLPILKNSQPEVIEGEKRFYFGFRDIDRNIFPLKTYILEQG